MSEYVGEGILNGRVHGCTGYTHTKGERGLSLEFTHAIIGGLKTAGILTRLVRCTLAPPCTLISQATAAAPIPLPPITAKHQSRVAYVGLTPHPALDHAFPPKISFPVYALLPCAA